MIEKNGFVIRKLLFTFAQILSLLEIFKTKNAVNKYILRQKTESKTVGLVPTMGALHAGHLSLIQKSKQICDITIATIFVNPTQFNNPNDLEKYPQPISLDVKLLQNAGCDALFIPSIAEMYQANETWDYKLPSTANSLEGAHRPGHFKGVTQIVYKLFKTIPATNAFFGQKDYQQFIIIQQLVNDFDIPIKLECCPIIRENTGLALSSRNVHLSVNEKHNALVLYNCLNFVKQNFKILPLAQLINNAEDMFKDLHNVKLEHVTICDKYTLQPVLPNYQKNAIAFVAAYIGNTRLIDNMILD